MDARQPLVVIVGPTASGKSSLALEAARRFGGEIIAADSRTVYTGMDIGTAKPTLHERRIVEHYCVDVTTPVKRYSAAQFQQCAYSAMHIISTHGHIPILVGGTGLYVDSVIFDYVFGPPADLLKRRELEKHSIDELITICQEKGIELPFNVKNKRHLVRAIEVGGVIRTNRKELRPNTLVVGLMPDKSTLIERMRVRAEHMLRSGLVEEAHGLALRYGWECEALKGNVYPVMRRLGAGEIGEPQAIEEMVKADMLLAKKQKTWFRRNQFIYWSKDPDALLLRIEQFLGPKSSAHTSQSLLQ